MASLPRRHTGIQAVLFDLDGTLLDRASSLERFLSQQHDRFARDLPAVDRKTYLETIIRLDSHGHTPKADVYRQVQANFHLSPDLGLALLDDFETHFHSFAIPHSGLHEMLETLSTMSVAMGIVSNGAVRSQRPKIEALRIAHVFGVILISEEQGVRKPDPEIYLRAMRQLNAVPETTVFVGDHPEADIEGAAKVGLKTIWKRNKCWPPPQQPDAIIDGLDEVPPTIALWSQAK
jgi:putative hydrolase of the HAD superfamily